MLRIQHWKDLGACNQVYWTGNRILTKNYIFGLVFTLDPPLEVGGRRLDDLTWRILSFFWNSSFDPFRHVIEYCVTLRSDGGHLIWLLGRSTNIVWLWLGRTILSIQNVKLSQYPSFSIENHHFWHVLVSNGLNDLYDAIKMFFFQKCNVFLYMAECSCWIRWPFFSLTFACKVFSRRTVKRHLKVDWYVETFN